MSPHYLEQYIGGVSQILAKTGQIIPYRVLSIMDSYIYEFWRVGSKNRYDIHNSATPKEMAMIILKKSGASFRVQYYPRDSKDLQVTEELPIGELGRAVSDLKAAGF